MSEKTRPRIPRIMSAKTGQPTASDLFCLPRTPGLSPNEGVARTFIMDLMAPGTPRQIRSTTCAYLEDPPLDAMFHGGSVETEQMAQCVIQSLGLFMFAKPHDAFRAVQDEERPAQRFQRIHNGVLEVALDVKESFPNAKRRHILVCCTALDCKAMAMNNGLVDAVMPGNVIRAIVAYEDSGSDSSWRIAHVMQLLCPLADDPL